MGILLPLWRGSGRGLFPVAILPADLQMPLMKNISAVKEERQRALG